MTVDATLNMAGLMVTAAVASIAAGSRLPLPGVSRSARADVGRMWGAILVVQAMVLVLAAVLASDPDGPPTTMLVIIGAAAAAIVVIGVWRTRVRIADDRKLAGRRKFAPDVG